ncbi:MAG: DUF922 domain-containing protein [Pseudomonadota bacterium]
MKKFSTRTLLLAICGISATVMTPQIANADVILKKKTKFYKVTGSNGVELYRSMASNGPDHGNSRQDVLASTSFKFDIKNVKAELQGNRCVVTDVDIIVDVTYTYPKWAGSRKASKATRKAWREFSELAVWHEEQHVNITKNFAKAYEKVLLKSRRRASNGCQQQTLSETFRTNIAFRKHERLHRRFDRQDLKRGGRGFEALKNLHKAK